MFKGEPHILVEFKDLSFQVLQEKLLIQNRSLELIIASVSHDARTPLNAILGIGRNLKPYIPEG
jgi:signal transduction histidine kinase